MKVNKINERDGEKYMYYSERSHSLTLSTKEHQDQDVCVILSASPTQQKNLLYTEGTTAKNCLLH